MKIKKAKELLAQFPDDFEIWSEETDSIYDSKTLRWTPITNNVRITEIYIKDKKVIFGTV